MEDSRNFPGNAQLGKRYYMAMTGLAQDERQAIDPDTLKPGSEANKTQVGGAHYASEFQHWDFVRELVLDYWQGCATKYVSRWRKKNGVEDLQKALHYVAKRRENATAPKSVDCHWGAHSYVFRAIFRFGTANDLNVQEVEAIAYIVRGEWDAATAVIIRMINERHAAEAAVIEEHFQK